MGRTPCSQGPQASLLPHGQGAVPCTSPSCVLPGGFFPARAWDSPWGARTGPPRGLQGRLGLGRICRLTPEPGRRVTGRQQETGPCSRICPQPRQPLAGPPPLPCPRHHLPCRKHSRSPPGRVHCALHTVSRALLSISWDPSWSLQWPCVPLRRRPPPSLGPRPALPCPARLTLLAPGPPPLLLHPCPLAGLSLLGECQPRLASHPACALMPS